MGEIRICCNTCQAHYWVAEEHIGQTAECEGCGSPILVARTPHLTIGRTATGPGEFGSRASVTGFDMLAPMLVLPLLGMRFVRVAPAEFVRCDTAADGSDRGPRVCRIGYAFWMAETLVTQTSYERIMQQNPSHFRGADLPVESVSWHHAQDFCHRLTDRARATNLVPRGAVFRLPTEAEWELATRSPEHPHAGPDPEVDLGALAWYRANSDGRTHAVAGKAPSARGLYDLFGNVGEWCADWFDAELPRQADNPTGPDHGERKARRGGSWNAAARRCRAEARLGVAPALRSLLTGFRPVLFLRTQTNTSPA